MQLSIKERMVLIGVLPEEGSLADMLMVRKLVEKVGLTAEDHELVNLRSGKEPNTVVWDEDKDPHKDIDFKGPETSLIVGRLKKLDAEQKLTSDHLSLCGLFGLDDAE